MNIVGAAASSAGVYYVYRGGFTVMRFSFGAPHLHGPIPGHWEEP